jgi:tetratricopeptide (TPR) repeat protein
MYDDPEPMVRLKGLLLTLAGAGLCGASPANEALLCYANSARNPDAAIRHCTAASESGGLSAAGLAAVFVNRCKAYAEKHDYARALPDCERAVQLMPKAVLPVYMRGLVRFYSGNSDGAMLDFEQAIRLDPNIAVAYAGRASVDVGRGRYERAIQDYGDALRLKPDGPTYYGRGWCYVQKRDYDSAVRDFDQAISLGAGAAAYYYRGWCSIYKGDYGRALPDLDQAIRLQPNVAASYSSRASVHAWRHEYDQAIRDYDQALRSGPDAESYYGRGWAYYQKGAYVSALRDFVQASWRKPALLGRWIWTPLLPLAWLIYMVLRRKKAKPTQFAASAQPLVPR